MKTAADTFFPIEISSPVFGQLIIIVLTSRPVTLCNRSKSHGLEKHAETTRSCRSRSAANPSIGGAHPSR